MLEKLRKLFFFLIVFFLSSQVGLHFWPKFSFISGVRVDYLSPVLYLLDILIVIFILLSLPEIIEVILEIRNKILENKFLKIIFLFFLADLVLNIFISESPGAHIFGLIKLSEFTLFAFAISKTFKKTDVSYFVDALALSAIVSSILGLWQFNLQKSIGGLWYFLGERSFNQATIGISTVNLGNEVLRPYAAFPHPNVLAFFLLTAIVFSVFRLPFEKNNERIFLFTAIIISFIGLLFTFSRISILLVICFLFYELYSKAKRNLHSMMVIFISISFLFMIFPQALESQFLFRGINFRQELLGQSFTILTSNLYFGTGLNNFFINQAPLIKTISPIVFQPVHNIFVLALLSFGIFGWWVFPLIFILAMRSLTRKLQTRNGEKRAFYQGVLFILVSIIIVGLFDHFFLTLEQGQIILAILMGLSFSKI